MKIILLITTIALLLTTSANANPDRNEGGAIVFKSINFSFKDEHSQLFDSKPHLIHDIKLNSEKGKTQMVMIYYSLQFESEYADGCHHSLKNIYKIKLMPNGKGFSYSMPEPYLAEANFKLINSCLDRMLVDISNQIELTKEYLMLNLH